MLHTSALNCHEPQKIYPRVLWINLWENRVQETGIELYRTLSIFACFLGNFVAAKNRRFLYHAGPLLFNDGRLWHLSLNNG